MRRIGEAIGARGQEFRQAAGPKRIARFGVVVLDTEQYLRDRAIGGGQDQVLAGLSIELIGLGELPGLLGQLPWHMPAQFVLVAKTDRNGSGMGRGLERGLRAGLAAGDGQGGAHGIARPINRPLGLTVYCWLRSASLVSFFRELKCHASTVQPCRISCRISCPVPLFRGRDGGSRGLGGCQTMSDITGSLTSSSPKAQAAPDDPRRAVEVYGERYRANPKDADAALGYGQALRATGQRAQATAVLEQATIPIPATRCCLPPTAVR